jgi:DNA-binding NtrC family response regulator
VISATHRTLKERIAAGAFREDLYYRVNVIEIALPALRERPGDLSLLVQYFLHRFTPKGRPTPTVSPAAWAVLSQYQYPGNVRELSHAIEHAVVLSGGGEMGVQHLPASMVSATLPVGRPGAADGGAAPEIRPLAVALREFEREYLVRAMGQAAGKRIRAAEMLGISRKSLWEKLRLHGISDAEAESREHPDPRPS